MSNDSNAEPMSAELQRTKHQAQQLAQRVGQLERSLLPPEQRIAESTDLLNNNLHALHMTIAKVAATVFTHLGIEQGTTGTKVHTDGSVTMSSSQYADERDEARRLCEVIGNERDEALAKLAQLDVTVQEMKVTHSDSVNSVQERLKAMLFDERQRCKFVVLGCIDQGGPLGSNRGLSEAVRAIEQMSDPITPFEVIGDKARSTSPTWPLVLRFAVHMERKLRANRHKGNREGWLKDEPDALITRLRTEVSELEETFEPANKTPKFDIISEAADVANFAMMLADVGADLMVDHSAPDAVDF